MTAVTVKTSGQTLTVQASISHWTSEALAVTASSANDVESTTTTTITSDYTLYFANSATSATITVKQLDGTVLFAAPLNVELGVGPRTLSPLPTVAQLAEDAGADSQLALAPTGALAETFPRVGNVLANTGTLSTGREHCIAIALKAGMVITNISFMSSVTAADTPTAYWFSLRTDARVLLAQTADQTTTAWGASTVKTLALSAPQTLTYSGLYYLGIMVAATTPPTLVGITGLATANGRTPIVNGYGDASLTTTAPATATALTTQSAMPWAWVS